MTKRQRTALFFTVAVLFVVVAPAVALYAQGYRLDLENRRLTQTGAYFFEVDPGSADISIDGEKVATTDFFFGTALTRNFLPGEHRVRISKEGFFPWEKTLELKERSVTEAKGIILFPRELNFRTVTAGIRDLWMGPSARRAVVLREGAGGEEAVSLNLETSAQEVLWKASTPEASLLDVVWHESGERLLLEVASRERVRRIVLHPQGEICRNKTCTLDFLGTSVEEASFSPNENRLIVQRRVGNRSILQEVDYSVGTTGSFWGDRVLAFAAAGENLVWLEEEGTLWRTSPAAQSSPKRIAETPLPVRRETSHTLLRLQDRVFLLQEGVLLEELPGEEELRRVEDGVREMAPSPDGKKLALSSPSEVWVHYVEERTEQPRHKAGDTVFLTRFGSPIGAPLWITSSHLAFPMEGALKVAEIDERDGLNVLELARFSAPGLFWQPEERFFYVVDEDALFASEKVIK